jgi:PAS domain S-box-containing protein
MVESASDILFNNETFTEVADAIPAALWRIGPCFEQDWANKHWLEFTGGRLEDEVNFGWVDKVHPDDRERVLEEFDCAFEAREASRLEYRVRGKDGVYRWFLDTGAPVYRRGEFAGFVGTCTDITERKRAVAQTELLQPRLIERSAAEASSIRSSVVVHEVNQPLTAISAHADALQSLIAGRADLPREFAEVAASVRNAADLAGDVLRNYETIVRHGTAEKRREDLSSVLRSVEPSIRIHPSAAEVRLNWNLAADLLAHISTTQIQQVLLNLAANGLHAMQGMPDRTLTISAAKWGDAAIVSVADRGPGVPEAMREQIFEAPVSSRADGMGLGLYLSRLIVTDHGGRIWVEENPGGGSIFRFKVPIGTGGEAP